MAQRLRAGKRKIRRAAMGQWGSLIRNLLVDRALVVGFWHGDNRTERERHPLALVRKLGFGSPSEAGGAHTREVLRSARRG